MFALGVPAIRRGALLALVAGLCGLATVTAAPSAVAASVSASTTPGLTITDVRTTSAPVTVGQQIRTDIDFTLADRTPAGRTAELTLPAALVSLPAGFDLRASDGSLVATAVISPTAISTTGISTGHPTLVTFTTTDYGRTHTGVHGTAFITDNFDAAVARPGRRTMLQYVSAGRTFTDVLTVSPGSTIDRTRSFEFGQFVRGDQGAAVAQGAVYWFVESPMAPEGGWAATEFKDPMAGGGSIECSSVTVTVGTAGGPGNSFTGGTGYGDYSFVAPCSTGGLDVLTGPVAAGKIIRVQFTADLDGPTGATHTSFENGASVVVQGPDGDPITQAAVGTLEQSAAGGTVDSAGLGSGSTAPGTSSRAHTTAATATTTTAAGSSTSASRLQPVVIGTPTSTPSTVTTAGVRTAASSSETTGSPAPGLLVGGGLLLFGAGLLIGRTRRRGRLR